MNSLPLDGQGRPFSGLDSFVVSKILTLDGSNETKVSPIFTLIGSVYLARIFGIVTTDLSSNVTAASLRINDQTAQVYLTAVGGTTLSAIKAGSMIVKDRLVATAISKIDNAAGAILEAAAIQTPIFSPIILVKKTAALTQIEFRYATTNTPATGVIQFFAAYVPLSADGMLVAA